MKTLPEHMAELTPPSEYLEEVLSTPPAWIVRWGQLVVLVLLLSLLVLAWLIQYPDRVPAQVVITSPNPPVAVVAQVGGPLDYLLVEDHQKVTAGTTLAVIGSAAGYQDVVQLQQQLSKLDENVRWAMQDSIFSSLWQLGSLQEAYSQMQQVRKTYALQIKHSPYYLQQQAVAKQLDRYERLLDQKARHQQILERKIALAEQGYLRQEQLHTSGAIADQELEAQERLLLDVQEAKEVLGTEVQQMQLAVTDLQREWQQLGLQHTEQGAEAIQNLESSVDNLAAQIKEWQKQHVLTAPVAGSVSFFDFWSQAQYVAQGQQVMSINPDTALAIIGKLKVAVHNFGKVTVGQKVQVYLDNYPYQQYGRIIGRVDNLSSLPKQGHYSVTISFPNGLVTQYNQQIPFQQYLQGRAEIITQERRLLERLFERLRVIDLQAGYSHKKL